MSETVLTTITFEPDWVAIYVDGDVYGEGHTYKESDILRDVLTDDEISVDETTSMHLYPDPWQGTPQTVEEAIEMYGEDDE